MTAFEHVLLLLSFVYAVALTHLLSSTAALIRAGSRVRFSWFHAGWMANAFIVIVANWLSFFDMRNERIWSVGTILFMLALAIANYLQAALVCMEMPAEGRVDMQAFHAAQGRKYIGAVFASVTLASIANSVLGDALGIGQWVRQNLVVIPMVAASVAAFIWIRGWVQAASLAVFAVCWALYFFFGLQAALR